MILPPKRCGWIDPAILFGEEWGAFEAARVQFIAEGAHVRPLATFPITGQAKINAACDAIGRMIGRSKMKQQANNSNQFMVRVGLRRQRLMVIQKHRVLTDIGTQFTYQRWILDMEPRV